VTVPMFRFTIRELVLVSAVVAVACGWWADHFRSTRREQQLRQYLSSVQKVMNEVWGRQVGGNRP